jgi:monofunctional biosynthetic peptidoglycan transglycosylase
MGILTSARFKIHRPGRALGLLLGLVLAAAVAVPVSMYFSRDVARLRAEFPHAIVAKDSVTFEVRKSRPRGWVSLAAVSRYATWAIVLSEDWSFYQHNGIDVKQIRVALGEMMASRKFRGASTITQQLVKNVYLSEERTLWRKLHEAILARKVERALSKERILETYLNVIEFGPGIYGIGAASRHYFAKAPAELGPREGAFLAMLLPGPKRYSASFRKQRLTSFARKRVEAILEKLRMGKVISSEQFSAEVSRKLAWER